MNRHFFRFFALFALIAAVLCGCGKTEDAPESPSPAFEAAETPDPHAGMVEVSNGAGGTIWVDDAEALEAFPLDRTLFSVENGVASYAGEGYTLIRGIDVSEFQGEVDWAAVRASGVDFVILRCGWRGYSGGTLNEDTRFRENVEGAKAAGLQVGAYFFSQATSLVEAAEEAVFTANLLRGYDLDLPVFFDWETIGTEPARTDGTDARTVTEAALEFCRLLESEGYASGVYSYIPDVYAMYELDRLAGVTLWMGDPGTQPEFWYDHALWQYSFSGSVPGIEGNVDMDVMYTETEAAG